jgi:hypothetical protein
MIMDFMWVPENCGRFVTVTLLYLECDIKTTVTSKHVCSCALTLPNPGYGQSHPTDVHQPMDQCGVRPNLT